MFCDKCGTPLDEGDRFCIRCGNRILKQEENVIKPLKKRKGKVFLIILSVYFGMALVALGINLMDMFIFNSARKLEDKLIDNTWYSEPMESVAVNGSKRMMSAYTIEFHDDGTATLTTYLGSCPAYDEIDAEDMEIFKTETISWEISGSRVLELDGEEYKCKTIFSEDVTDCWYVNGDKLHINRTYYREDEWGYVSK